MHVLMVDDHLMFLQGLKNLLGVMAPHLEIDCASTLQQALASMRSRKYELVLLDWNLGDCQGDHALLQMREQNCLAPIVILSGQTNGNLVHDAIEMGAAAFIPKQYSSEMMISALDQVLAGCVFVPPDGGGVPQSSAQSLQPLPLESDPRLAGLTPRQLDVYRAAARGLPNKLIARELGIAGSTVKSHLSAVFAALGVRNRTEAAYLASREATQVFKELRGNSAGY